MRSFSDSIFLFFITVTQGNGTVYVEVKCVESYRIKNN